VVEEEVRQIQKLDLGRVRLSSGEDKAEEGLTRGSAAWKERIYAYRPAFFDDERFYP